MIADKNKYGDTLRVSLLCLDAYVNKKWSYRRIAKNLLMSHTSVKNYLEKLQYNEPDLYDMYLAEKRRREK